MIYLNKLKYTSVNYERSLDLCGNIKRNMQKVRSTLILCQKRCAMTGEK